MKAKITFLTIFLAWTFLFANPNSTKGNTDFFSSQVYVDPSVKSIEDLLKESEIEEGVFHLFAHGKPGKLFINNEWLKGEEIIDFIKSLILDEAGISQFSHLNIYACDFGKGNEGLVALKSLQSFFPEGIAASDNKVGNKALGGDWEMEVVLGSSKNVLKINTWKGVLQITFSSINSYTNTTPLNNFNCAGYTTMDASLVYNNAPMTITFSCPVTSASIPVMSLGDSNVELYSFDAVGSPETLSTTCPNVTISGNTATNNTGSAGTSGVEFYLDLSSTVPFTQIIVTKISGSFAAGIMNPSSGYWTDPCAATLPCTPPNACNVSGPPTLTSGGTASFNSGTPSPAGTTSSWTISPTTGVSTTSGSGSVAGSITFANAGTFTVTFTHTNSSSPSGCFPGDSTVCASSITVTGPCVTVTDSSNQVACDSAQINGNWYFSSQAVQDTFIAVTSNNCDSIHTTNLTINNSNSTTDIQVSCDSIIWIDGVTYFSDNNTASQLLVNTNGCDSLVMLNLTINNSVSVIDAITACESYTWIDGITYTANNNTATHTLIGSNNCDSTINLNLTINNADTTIDTRISCDSLVWLDGVTYFVNNNTASVSLSNSNGCDSIVILNLTINNSTTGVDSVYECGSFTWIDGNTYFANNNNATHTLTGSNSCDSVVTLDLTIYTSVTITDVLNTCDSLTWIDGITYTANNNTATHILPNPSGGCDTLITLDLTVNMASAGIDNISSCAPILWIDGNIYSSANNSATHTLLNTNGCDSVVTLNLTITSPDTTTDFRFACDSFTWIDGNTYVSSNSTALHTIAGGSSDGCDSIVALNLQILPTRYGNDTIQACDSVLLNNAWYTSSQTVMDTMVFNASCDSITSTYIIIENNATIPVINIDTTLCIGETLNIDAVAIYGLDYSYQWENNAVNSMFETNQSGLYILTIIDSNQCEYAREALFTFEDCSEDCKVVAPTGFSPNEDGQNDVFKIFRICEAEFLDWEVKIYNRWGELIFKSSDFLDTWDGSYNNKIAPLGVYSYSIEYFIDGSSEKQLVKGMVTLIR